MDNSSLPPQAKSHDELQAALHAGRTRWWSRIPGISSARTNSKAQRTTSNTAALPPEVSSPQPLEVQLPTITVDSSEVCFTTSSRLPEATGIIDPTLLHAPFLREPLFVPSPGSGRKALRRWFPSTQGEDHPAEVVTSSAVHASNRRPKLSIKYWVHYAEPEFYYTISAGQPLRLCGDGGAGNVYQIQGDVGSLGQGLAFWAEPEEDRSLPLAVVLFLPPGTRCHPSTSVVLQELAYEAILSAVLESPPHHI